MPKPQHKHGSERRYVRNDVMVRHRTKNPDSGWMPSEDQKKKALFNFWDFVDLIGFHGGRTKFSECHKDLTDWAFHKDRSARKLMLMPRGHFKSTIMAVGRTLWRIYQNPNIRIFIGSADFALSKSIIREIKTYLEDEELQEKVWNNRPHKKGRLVPLMDKLGKQRRQSHDTEADDKKVVWRADAIQVVRDDILKEPTVVAGSAGATATGFHYDEVIFDDVVTFDNIDTEPKRDKLFRWIYDMESVLDPMQFDEDLLDQFDKVESNHRRRGQFKQQCYLGDTVIVVGTKYDPEDYYQHILNNVESLGFDVYERNIYVNGTDNEDGYIFPEKFNEALENRLRASMSDRRFASQYLNQIITEGTQLLAWDKINFIHPTNIICNQPNTASIRQIHNEPREIKLKAVVDPAATANEYSDYTCIAVGGLDDKNNFYVVDLQLLKDPFSVWVKKMFEMLDKWNLSAVTVETVAFQKQLVYSIREMFDTYRPITVREWKPDTRSDKHSRIEAVLQPLFENEKFYMNQRISQIKGIQDQFNLFGRSTVKDDAPDACSILKSICVPPNSVVQPFNPRKQIATNTRYGGFV